MHTITATVNICNAPAPRAPSLPAPSRARVSNEAFWRKQLILRRDALQCQWHQLFPQHDFGTGRRIRRPLDWDDEAWARAARAYHAERKRTTG
jgi:hypothetical protein